MSSYACSAEYDEESLDGDLEALLESDEEEFDALRDDPPGAVPQPGTTDDLTDSSATEACPPPGQVLGGWGFCSEACPCGNNQGDCDSEDECLPGLECVEDIGANYGWAWNVDVCKGCSPASRLPGQCGNKSDGCGGIINCGPCPPTVNLTSDPFGACDAGSNAVEYFMTATASGGDGSYSFSWSGAIPSSAPWQNPNLANAYFSSPSHTVTVTVNSGGLTDTDSITVFNNCL
ncbi:MAG: hypothetical protein AAGF11_53795 [Myxococcota bacterium]